MALSLLIDTNVALDFILEREPFFETSRKVIDLPNEHDVTEFVSATTVTDIYYITYRHLKDRETVMALLRKFLRIVKVANVTHKEIYMAMNLYWKDFEDSVQYSVAKSNNFDGIVTRNMEGFDEDDAVKIFTPEEICEYVEENLKE